MDLTQVRDVILDDREGITVGKKLREALKTGYRFVVLFGKHVLDPQGARVELHCTKTGQIFDVSISEVVPYLKALMEREDDDM